MTDYSDFLDDVRKAANEALAEWSAAHESLVVFGFDPKEDVDVSGSVPYSLSDLNSMFLEVLHFVASMKLRSGVSPMFLHDGQWSSLNSAIQSVKSNSEAIINAVGAANKLATKPTITTKGLQYTIPPSQSGNFLKSAQSAYQGVQDALAAAFALAPALRIRGVGDLTQQAEGYRKVTADLEALLSEARRLLDEMTKRDKESVDVKNRVESTEELVNSLATVAKDQGKDIGERLGEAQQVVGRLRELLQEARSLESQVEKYQADFETFQQQIDGRFTALEAVESRHKTLQSDLEEARKRIEATTAEAEGMSQVLPLQGYRRAFQRHLRLIKITSMMHGAVSM